MKKALPRKEGLCRIVTLSGHMRKSETTLLGSRLVWALALLNMYSKIVH